MWIKYLQSAYAGKFIVLIQGSQRYVRCLKIQGAISHFE